LSTPEEPSLGSHKAQQPTIISLYKIQSTKVQR